MIVVFRALHFALLPAPEARPICFLLHMETKLLSENQSSLIPISFSITTIIMEVETFKSVQDNCALCNSLSTGQLASSNTYPGGEGQQPSKSYKQSKSQISSSGSSRMLGVSIQGQLTSNLVNLVQFGILSRASLDNMKDWIIKSDIYQENFKTPLPAVLNMSCPLDKNSFS